MLNTRVERFIRLLQEDIKLRQRCNIGRGSSRSVYEFGDMVIKLPCGFFQDDVDDMGILQSKKEIDVWCGCGPMQRKLLASMYAYGEIDNVPYIVMEKITVAEDVDCSPQIANYEIADYAQKHGFRIVKNYWRILNHLIGRFNLKEADLFENAGNFGITKDKKIVLCDYGFCGWSQNSYGYDEF